MGFDVPGPRARLQAIGATETLSPRLQHAFAPSEAFEVIPVPGKDDWLATHREQGQTFDQFRTSLRNQPNTDRRTIYLQPLGALPDDVGPFIEKLREYAQAFFQMDVKALAPILFERDRFTNRTNSTTGRRQLLTGDLLHWLKTHLPSDAFCLLGITWEDLYPEPSWNFVFGQASLIERIGVYSFARYEPSFYGQPRETGNANLVLKRSMKVLTHETGHMFGLTHCIYFACVMNGSNHLKESDRRPAHLCPVCLRKLQFSTGFDVLKRYQDLARFDEQSGFLEEAGWLRSRIETLRSKSP